MNQLPAPPAPYCLEQTHGPTRPHAKAAPSLPWAPLPQPPPIANGGGNPWPWPQQRTDEGLRGVNWGAALGMWEAVLPSRADPHTRLASCRIPCQGSGERGERLERVEREHGRCQSSRTVAGRRAGVWVCLEGPGSDHTGQWVLRGTDHVWGQGSLAA